MEIFDATTGDPITPTSVGLTSNRDVRPGRESFMVTFFKDTEDHVRRKYRLKRDAMLAEAGETIEDYLEDDDEEDEEWEEEGEKDAEDEDEELIEDTESNIEEGTAH